jgi:hypothetical protein
MLRDYNWNGEGRWTCVDGTMIERLARIITTRTNNHSSSGLKNIDRVVSIFCVVAIVLLWFAKPNETKPKYASIMIPKSP